MRKQNNKNTSNILTKEFLTKEIIQNDKIISQISKEQNICVRTIRDYCHKFEIKLPSRGNFNKYLNQKIHMMTIKKIFKEKRIMCECECECGVKKTLHLASILHWGIKSCGCLKKKLTRLKFHQEISRSYWNNLINKCIIHNYEITITIEDVWSKYLQQNRKCALTGLDISWGTFRKRTDQTVSVDRIDSNVGYRIDNIQLVHKIVNIMKGFLSNEEFICFCNAVAKTHPRSLEEYLLGTARKLWKK